MIKNIYMKTGKKGRGKEKEQRKNKEEKH